MAPDIAAVIRDALALDADQRAIIANVLLESLYDAADTSEVDAVWRTEATRRLADIRAGAVDLVDANEHYARLRASLTENQPDWASFRQLVADLATESGGLSDENRGWARAALGLVD